MSLTFKKAQRTAVKLKALVSGPSGSGKTLGALKLAEALGFDRIAVLDSENDRASYYADVVAFDVISLSDGHPNTYKAGIQAAVDAEYPVVIVDSLSHAWQNVLDRKTEYERANPKSNNWTNWKIFGGEWDSLMRAILDSPIHVIATSRSKQEYEQIQEGDKKRVIKLGMAPQIREGSDYEFALHLDLNEAHKAQVRKDNTFLFGDDSAVFDLLNDSIAGPLRKWLSTAKPVESPTAETLAKMDAAIAALPEADQGNARRRWAQRRQKGVSESEAQGMLAKMGTKADALA